MRAGTATTTLNVSSKGILIKTLDFVKYTANPSPGFYFYIPSSINTIQIDSVVGTFGARVMPADTFFTLPTDGNSYNFRSSASNTEYLWIYSSGFNQNSTKMTNFRLK